MQSMTGFARGQAQGDWGVAVCEMRSVNHRYLEFTCKLPEVFRDLETPIREQLRQALARGKIDISLRFQPSSRVNSGIAINQDLARALATANQTISEQTATQSQLRAFDILRWPGVVEPAEVDLSPARTALLALITEVVTALQQARIREGEDLKTILAKRAQQIQSTVRDLNTDQTSLLKAQQAKLASRLAALPLTVDPTRLEQEIVLLVQRSDITEEIDRLNTHIAEISHMLSQGGVMGRKLDFLIQECHREANTITAKAAGIGVTQIGITLKVLVEQMREQVQNIE